MEKDNIDKSNEIKKDKFERQAQVSMGALDFERYHRLLLKADDLHSKLPLRHKSDFLAFNGILNTIFSDFRNLFPIEVSKEIQEELNQCDILIDDIQDKNSFNEGLPKLMKNVYNRIKSAKQRAGLGQRITRRLTKRERLRKAILS